MAAIPEPTPEQLQAMICMADILNWAGLKGNHRYKCSMAGALFESLGGEEAAGMSIDEFGAIKDEDLEAAITNTEWVYSRFDEDPGTDMDGERVIKPKALHKNMARKAHRAAGIWAGLVKPIAQAKFEDEQSARITKQYKEEKLTLLRETAASAAATLAATSSPGDSMVKMSEIVDVNNTRVIPLMLQTEFNQYFLNFKIGTLRGPKQGEEPSVQQLTAMRDNISKGTIYADPALFGANERRVAKALKDAPLLPSQAGWVRKQFDGPPDYRTFRVGYDVWAASIIMLKAVRAEWVVALGDKIKEYNEAYGHKVWPLLYQCYDRFMKEQAPRILRRETLKLNAAIAASRTILGEGLDVKMPFDWIFELIVGDDNRGPA